MNIKQITLKKDEGNQLFKQKKYEQSITKFQSCITDIEASQSKDFVNGDSQIGKLYIVCLINASLACINCKKQQKYDIAISYCDKALSIDPNNIKGLYRRGLARKQKAQAIERQKGVAAQGLLQLYEKAQVDFQKLCLVDKTNQLATKNFKLILNDVYRVKIGRGDNAFDQKSKNKEKGKMQQTSKQVQEHEEKPRKKGGDMSKIMKDYKVQEVTAIVQQKVRSQYLTKQLPVNKLQFQKALRTLQKSQQSYILFVYRLNQPYLASMSPTFDTLGSLTNVLLKHGKGDEARNALSSIHKQKSFKLLWKSLSSKQKQTFKNKWKQFGLSQQALI